MEQFLSDLTQVTVKDALVAVVATVITLLSRLIVSRFRRPRSVSSEAAAVLEHLRDPEVRKSVQAADRAISTNLVRIWYTGSVSSNDVQDLSGNPIGELMTKSEIKEIRREAEAIANQIKAQTNEEKRRKLQESVESISARKPRLTVKKNS